MKNVVCLLIVLACMVISHTYAQQNNPLIYSTNFEYVGAFKVSTGANDVSQAHDVEGGIEFKRLADGTETIFITGNTATPGIAQYTVPTLSPSLDHNDLAYTGPPIQEFFNPLVEEGFDWLADLLAVDNKLFFAQHEYYPASNLAMHRMGMFTESSSLDSCEIIGSLSINAVSGIEQAPAYDAPQSAGWMAQLPDEWASLLGGTHIYGPADGWNVAGMNHVGPSVFVWNPREVATTFSSTPLVDYSQAAPIQLLGQAGEGLINAAHDMWNSMSQIHIGFIPEGTRTLVLIGNHHGINDDIGYKITQDSGRLCGGPCPFQAADTYNFYWLIDMQHVLDARAGNRPYDSIKPYNYGVLNVPFETTSRPDQALNYVKGGAYDAATGRVFLNVVNGNPDGTWTWRPVVTVFTVSTDAYTPPISITGLQANGSPITGTLVVDDACSPGSQVQVNLTWDSTIASTRLFFENQALSYSNNQRGMRFGITTAPGTNNASVLLNGGTYRLTVRAIDANGVQSH